ncbi:uncharacterized protein LOC110686480 [Chenopodium quinoa]|uniref:uncharacterized protein LOC110686480 n=1 Tax=Chenopodium quinoa TaxID=63459 RepID=UPI000B77774A|nr:uncharacterized protein LOC110686480 [Chenopodium quinoa]
MSLKLKNKKVGSNMGKVLKKLTDLAENITQVANQGKGSGKGDTFGEVFKGVAAAKPPFFLGKEDPSSLENWIREFDKLFDAINCPDNMKVNNVVYYLKEEADLWWTQKKEELMVDPNFGWEDFKVALRKKFYPDHLRKQKCLEFTNLRMGTMTVSEYYSKFLELMRFAPEVVPTEAIKAQRFEQGLTWNLQGKLGGTTFESLDEVYGRAAHLYGIKGRELGSMSGEKIKSNDQPQGSDKRPKNHASFGNGNHGDKRDFKGNFWRISNHGGENRENKERNKRSYFCKRCEKDHPGKDCAGNKVTC